MTLNLSMPGQEELKPRITVFGVGGAGGNAVLVMRCFKQSRFLAASAAPW